MSIQHDILRQISFDDAINRFGNAKACELPGLP